MRRIALAVALTAGFALPAQSHAEAQSGDVGMVILDVALVRPLCVVGSLVSTAVGIGTIPLTWPMGVGDEAAQLTIHAPWRFTAGRVPGRFDVYEDGGDIMGPRP